MTPHHGDLTGASTAKLSADVTSVCEELQLPSSVAAVLAAAAAKGRISSNPGVLLPQVSSWAMVMTALASQPSCLALVWVHIPDTDRCCGPKHTPPHGHYLPRCP